jgi:hypothetical protein
VLDGPPGAVVHITNGAYPAQIVGDYCTTAVYVEDQATTTRYDQISRFRFARRFAQAFSPLEAYSSTTVYYMLNPSVKIGLSNEVRLHGEAVDRLRVALIAADESYLPPLVAEPCTEGAPRPSIAIKTACASTYSPGYEADKLIDGLLTTGWASEPVESDSPQEVVLDLGAPQAVSGIRWTPHVDFGMLSPSSIVVATSLDGVDYREVLRIDEYRPSQVQWLTNRFQPHLARYVRLTAVPEPHFGISGRYEAALGEIEVLR